MPNFIYRVKNYVRKIFISNDKLNLIFNIISIITLITVIITIYYIFTGIIFKNYSFDIILNIISNISIILSILLGLLNILAISKFFIVTKGQKHSIQKRITQAFTMMSIIPAILIIGFFVYFFQFSIQSWFDNKISNVLNESVLVGNAYIKDRTTQLKEIANSITIDIRNSSQDEKLLSNIFNELVNIGPVDEIILFNKSNGHIIAQTDFSSYLSLFTINSSDFLRAIEGEMVELSNDPNKMRILVNITSNIYLLVGKWIDRNIINHIDQTNGTTSEYLRLKLYMFDLEKIGLQIFISVFLTILLFGTIFAKKFAKNLVQPIQQLLIASEKVRGGDLSTKVVMKLTNQDEFTILISTFNMMIQQIAAQQKKLLAAQKALAWSDVARRIAHEIKNPLTPIQLSAELLVKKFLSEVTNKDIFQRYIDNILKHSNVILSIASEFVNFSTFPKPIFVIQDIISLIKSHIFSRKIINEHIDYIFESNTNKLDFICDVQQIDQVLMNILQNAEESLASTEKSYRGKIHILVKYKFPELSITCIDNGPGFTNDIIHHVKEPYVTSKVNGTGLGLSIVDRIVQEHCGYICTENNLVLYSNTEKPGAKISLIFNLEELKNKL
ncbi:sensor histidine kinase [Rickettsia endosymbiont of Cardiosporidium cionae]|uniref:sensor histidine kinase n=1 Tax=Rickettsia endosymbiont of Cardiosporidium cionae TaxID=2777155 RepID=UPI001894BC02|nr:ATP-binding protein [Rickettsia endosymbiont of Cardiosporidium cionae]KAF8818311.1 PAS domain-containing sensor histidine kinase [Rickettsia endosymbiont of Cardiosporidium cionae]